MKCEKTHKPGFVSLVGAGPGDIGLFTLRGVERLKSADVVVYDYLANEKLLNYCKPDCHCIYVGKKAAAHTLSQESINTLMVGYSQEGKTVVRLKGGDPFIFGRGGEEALHLLREGVAFEVVPGITAGIAGPAYAGIPLTHRALSSSVSFITGHESAEKSHSSIDWHGIARGSETLVFYMGVKNLPTIMDKLKTHGRSGDTPVAIIQWGTQNFQKTITGTVGSLSDVAQTHGIKPPAVVVVGEVVQLREKIRWFDKKPITGKRIVVTRSRTQASELSRALHEKGAVVEEFPTIDISPVDDLSRLDTSLQELHRYSWIIFTSVNGVELFFRRLFDGKTTEAGNAERDSRALAGVKIAVIGSATAEAVRKYGVVPDLVPRQFTSVGIIEAFDTYNIAITGQSILLPGSEIAGDYLPEKLKEMGADVESVPVYRNRKPDYSAEQVKALMRPLPHLVTFTSSSTVTHFVEIINGAGMADLLYRIRGASIGPVTSDTAKELGIPVAVEAGMHTIEGLVHSIEEFIKKEGAV